MSGRHTVRALAVAALLACAASGCTEKSATPKPLPSQTASSSSAAASPSEAPPTMPAEATGRDAASAEAFVRHWIEVLNYSGPRGQSTPLRDLSATSCVDCDAISDYIDEVAKNNGRISGKGWTVATVRAGPAKPNGLVVVRTRVKVNPQTVVMSQGQTPRRFPGGTRAKTFRLEPSGPTWTVVRLDQATE